MNIKNIFKNDREFLRKIEYKYLTRYHACDARKRESGMLPQEYGGKSTV